MSLCAIQTQGQQTPTLTRHRLLIAERKWALQLDLPTIPIPAQRARGTNSAFLEPTEGFTTDGSAALLLTSKVPSGVKGLSSLSVVVEPAAQILSAADFRAVALKKFPRDARSIKYLDHASIPLARYTTDSTAARLQANFGIATPGAPLTARNLEAFLVKDDVWARIRFTADSINAEEELLFYSVINSAQFVDISNPSNSFDYYSIGRAFSARKDYRSAAENFTSALKLARIQPEFAAGYLHDLVMKSAEAYVMTSDLAAAVEALEYGVTRNPANETLLMQLARNYARMGNKAKTLATLETAFRLMKKEKEIFEKTAFPGTTSHTMSLPDLNRDPAFKEMMKDKAFREAVKAFKN